ncbi:hypothetical protein [Actinotalea sp. K2]|uniref:hypothetical protein n=1 Tax=Actinotalea sp. K2 TaxID=2939438 RepID=UPI002016D2E4|nr:hypothetical protein [Actinotalea sp. K2]MCL3861284.1 hypothetical protein [Actinotalea sp. K2]
MLASRARSLLEPSLIAYNGYNAGLGNRVRVVLGAKALAEAEERQFLFVWPTGRLFGPDFSDLWRFEGTTIPRAVSRAMARWYPYVDETLTWLDDDKRTERVWQIRTGSPLAQLPGVRPWQDELRALELVPEVQRAVTSFYDEHLRGHPYVGVMIRAHANQHARTREASPVEWFVRRMTEIARDQPGTRFYVSCDVPEVQERVVATVPGCVGQRDKGAFNSVEGVRAALCDVYLLACAGYLIAPYYSSFVHLSEHLSGDVLVAETSLAGRTGGVDVVSAGTARDPLRPYERS